MRSHAVLPPCNTRDYIPTGLVTEGRNTPAQLRRTMFWHLFDDTNRTDPARAHAMLVLAEFYGII